MNSQLLDDQGSLVAGSVRRALFIAAVTTVVGVAHATQPPDNVQSDSGGNTAMGTDALFLLHVPNCSSNSACENIAAGVGALYANSTGSYNEAYGFQSLNNNLAGSNNAAYGYRSLHKNKDGSNNTAIGTLALYANTASYNTASGALALESNTTGDDNTASGAGALENNTGGFQNTAYGAYALVANVAGNNNTAVGFGALNETAGSANIGIGQSAGGFITSGSNNIDIGSYGASSDDGKIRIGTEGTQKSTFIAGIADSKVTGAAVYVTSSGQLGVLASSERYKTDIESLGTTTQRLQQLRPVSFHLKTDPGGAVQYGLIAEEVDKIYPELVIRDDKGVIQGVRYDELAPMLLNALQNQQATINAQADRLAGLDARIALLSDRAETLQRQLAEVLPGNQGMRAAHAQATRPVEGTGVP
jgi:hypothetical protein